MMEVLSPSRTRTGGLAALLLVILVGCESDETRLSRQSERLVDLQADVAESATRLVESDAAARSDWVDLQGDLENQRLEIGRQRDLLEEDRRRIASQRLTGSIIAAAIPTAGLLIVCALPLVICWLLLRRADQDDGAEVVCSVLLEDLAADRPQLTAPPEKRIEPN